MPSPFDPSPDSESTSSPQVWVQQGDALRQAKRYAEASTCYTNALAQDPNHLGALNGQTYTLAMQRQEQAAMDCSDRAIALYPHHEEPWLCRSIVFFQQRRYTPALECCDRALALNPVYARAWYNRGVILLRLGQEEAALRSFEQATTLNPNPKDAWYPLAWMYQGYGLLRSGQFQQAIAACDRALALQPSSYSATLYRVASLIASGQLWAHLRQPDTRRLLWQNVMTMAAVLKYRVLGLVGAIALLTWGHGTWMDALKQSMPYILSFGIIAILCLDIWQHKSRLSMVWRTYMGHSWLTYLRAAGILIVTLGTYAVVSPIAPPFLQWGWANWVFGQPGNILFQPFNLLQWLPVPLLTRVSTSLPLAFGWTVAQLDLSESLGAIAPFLSYRLILILGFWALLLLGIPFWAQLEERLFRKGANTWRQIAVRSTQFGLVHLLAGIPLLGGLVLIIPGFFFACRYKYVHDRYLRRGHDAIAAQDAGVAASTVDHAIYNAILVTLVVAVMVIL